MSDNTKIEWTDATINAVNGCSVVSPGCKHCYAMKQAHRFDVRRGLTTKTAGGMVWTGEVRFNEKALMQPLAWKRARRIFWNAHGDLFHDSVPDEWIDKVFAVCALTPQHSHQILTKRSARMRKYMARLFSGWILRLSAAINSIGGSAIAAADHPNRETPQWPLPNVWLGVSVEDQQRADERIPDLLATPAAVRFLSCEPLLGAVDIRAFMSNCYECGASCGLRLPAPPQFERCVECGEECGPDTEPVFSEGCPKCSGELEPICPDCDHYMVYQHPDTPVIDWVIIGGESGHDARPMYPDWARSLRDQCAAAGVPMLFKQWGEWAPMDAAGIGQDGPVTGRGGGVRDWMNRYVVAADGTWARRVRGHSFTEHSTKLVYQVGKKAAGRLLDGVQHDGMPA